MLNRKYTNAINWILDNLMPPILRDSKIFMFTLMRLVLGPKYKYYVKFKDEMNELSESDINNYYSILSDTFLKRATDLNDLCVDYILNNLVGESVLDVGCGRGYFCRNMVASGNMKKVYGLDLVTRDNKPCDFITYVCGSILNLQFENKSFDTVICAHTLEHIRDINKALEEIRRVAKKRLIIVMPRQREYKYTFDLHIHFAPYLYSFKKILGETNGKFMLLGNDFIYIEEISV